MGGCRVVAPDLLYGLGLGVEVVFDVLIDGSVMKGGYDLWADLYDRQVVEDVYKGHVIWKLA